MACEHHDHHDSNHEQRHSENLAVHGRGHDLSRSVVSFSSSGGSCRGESQGTKNVHNQVNVDQLSGVEDSLSLGGVADDHSNYEGEVAGDLELQEAAHVHVDVAAPLDGLEA